jgi:hypothetical protein
MHKVLRLVTNQQVPTPQAIGTWLRRLGKDNQGIKALRKANKVWLVNEGLGCLWYSPNR